MNRTGVELSDGAIAPVYDNNTGSGEDLLSFDFSYLTVWSRWNTWAGQVDGCVPSNRLEVGATGGPSGH